MGQRTHDACVALVGQQGVADGVEPHVGTDEDVVPDRHGGFVEDRQVEVADEMVADRDLLPEVAVERDVDGEIPADAPEQPADDRLALFAAARGQPVEFEDQFLGTPQGFADLRADGVEPEARLHFFKIVHRSVLNRKHTLRPKLRGVLSFRIFRSLLRNDRFARANACAGAAVDALVGVDDVDVAGRNSLYQALADAGAACYAGISDFVSHCFSCLWLMCAVQI